MLDLQLLLVIEWSKRLYEPVWNLKDIDGVFRLSQALWGLFDWNLGNVRPFSRWSENTKAMIDGVSVKEIMGLRALIKNMSVKSNG